MFPSGGNANDLSRQNAQRLRNLSSANPHRPNRGDHIQNVSITNAVRRDTNQLFHDIKVNHPSHLTTYDDEVGKAFFHRQLDEGDFDVNNLMQAAKNRDVHYHRKDVTTSSSSRNDFDDVDRKLLLKEEELILNAIEESFKSCEESCHQQEIAWQRYTWGQINNELFISTKKGAELKNYDSSSDLNRAMMTNGTGGGRHGRIGYNSNSQHLFVGETQDKPISLLSREEKDLAEIILHFATDEAKTVGTFDIDPSEEMKRFILRLKNHNDEKKSNAWDELLKIVNGRKDDQQSLKYSLLESTLEMLGFHFYDRVVKSEVDENIKYNSSRNNNPRKDELTYITQFVERVKERIPKYKHEDRDYMIIYYCLRCYKIDAALRYAQSKDNTRYVATLLNNYYPPENVPNSSKVQVGGGQSSSIYEKIVYALLTGDNGFIVEELKEELYKEPDSLWGRADIIEQGNEGNSESTTISNRCWSDLWLANNTRKEKGIFTLGKLILKTEQKDADYFDTSRDIVSQTFTFITVLFRCQRFESAIMKMFDNFSAHMNESEDVNSLLVHCVHIAILLQYNGLFCNLPDSFLPQQQQASSSQYIQNSQALAINQQGGGGQSWKGNRIMRNADDGLQEEFNNLIRHYYLRRLLAADANLCANVTEAVHYFFLIRPSQELKELLKELTLRCAKNHYSLEELHSCLSSFADRPDEQKIQFYEPEEGKYFIWNNDEYRYVLTEAANEAHDVFGLKSEAINLNLLAKNYVTAFKIMSENLSITLDPRNECETAEIQLCYSDALRMQERYSEKLIGKYDDDNNKRTFQLLLKFVKFTDDFNSQNYQSALETIYAENIFPKYQSDIKKLTEEFQSLSKLVQENIAQVLLNTMYSLTVIYEENNNRHYNREILDEIQVKAKTLLEYVSLISHPDYLPQRTVRDLARLQNNIK